MNNVPNIDKEGMQLENPHTLLKRFPSDRRHTLAILQEFQKEYSYISAENLKLVASYLNIPLSTVFSMATFYKALSLDKKGKFVIKVCDGTACHIGGALPLLAEIKAALGINPGETTADGLFSVEVVNCMGACAMAPIIVVDEEHYGKVKPDAIGDIVGKYRNGGRTDER